MRSNFPVIKDMMRSDTGDPLSIFFLLSSVAAWKHRYSAKCLSVVHDQAFGARTPSYKVIQDLDRKVRTWYVPPNLQVPGFSGSANSKIPTGEVEQPSVQLTMQRYTAFAIKEMSEYISTLKFDNDELVTDVIFFSSSLLHASRVLRASAGRQSE